MLLLNGGVGLSGWVGPGLLLVWIFVELFAFTQMGKNLFGNILVVDLPQLACSCNALEVHCQMQSFRCAMNQNLTLFEEQRSCINSHWLHFFPPSCRIEQNVSELSSRSVQGYVCWASVCKLPPLFCCCPGKGLCFFFWYVFNQRLMHKKSSERLAHLLWRQLDLNIDGADRHRGGQPRSGTSGRRPASAWGLPGLNLEQGRSSTFNMSNRLWTVSFSLETAQKIRLLYIWVLCICDNNEPLLHPVHIHIKLE